MTIVDVPYIRNLLKCIEGMKEEMRRATLESYGAVPRSGGRTTVYHNHWLDAKARIDTMQAEGINVPNLLVVGDLNEWETIFTNSWYSPNAWTPSQQKLLANLEGHFKQLFGRITEPLEVALKRHETNKGSSKELMTAIRSCFPQVTPSFVERMLAGLNEKIRLRSDELFSNGHLDEAVLAAMKAIEEELRAKIKAEPDCCGMDLVNRAMSQQAPLVVFSDVSAEQQSAVFLFRGAVGFLRNPQAHRFIDIDDKQEALEQLCFASMLMRMLDCARVVPSVGK